METHAGEPAPDIRRGRFFRRVGRTLSVIIGLFFLLILVIHLPPVQRMVVGKLTTSMSEILETRVEIGSFTLHPVSDLTLHDVFIGSPGHPEDTLINARHLSVDYRRIWDVAKRRLRITQLGVTDGYLQIHRLPGETLNNLDVALGRLLPPANPNKPPFVLDLRSIQANALRVRVNDEVSGTWLDFQLPRADVIFNKLDITGKYLDLEEVDADDPTISVIIRQPTDLPDTTANAADTTSWAFDIALWRLTNGKFTLTDPAQPVATHKLAQSLDFAHLDLDDVDMHIDSLVIRGWNFEGVNPRFHIRHANGFEIEEMSARRARVASDGLAIEDLFVRTPGTQIANSVRMDYAKYNDFAYFSKRVGLEVPDANIRLAIADLLVIAPVLQTNTFLYHNKDRTLSLAGNASGILNDFRIGDLEAGLGGIALRGGFRSQDMFIAGRQQLRFDLTESTMEAGALRDILPGVRLPDFVGTLGRVRFTGIFDGRPDDFMASGLFTTQLGGVDLDLTLQSLEALDGGSFSGRLGLRDFDLGRMLDVPKLGKVNFAGRVIEATGIGTKDMYADLTGEVATIVYNGYTYHNARIDGQLNGKSFVGTLDVVDPNMDVHLEGLADLNGPQPRLNFISRVETLRLWELGFTRTPVTAHGVVIVDMLAGGPDRIQGRIDGEAIRLTRGDSTYVLDSLHVTGAVDTVTGMRAYALDCDLATAAVAGRFQPSLLVPGIRQHLLTYYPSVVNATPDTARVFIPAADSLAWNVHVYDSRDWLDWLGLTGINLQETRTSGVLKLGEGMASGYVELPEIHARGINVYSTSIDFDERQGSLHAAMDFIAADIRENFFFEEVQMEGKLTDDRIEMNVRTDHLADIVDKLDLDIIADPDKSAWNIAINPRQLVMLGQRWAVPAGNRVEISKDHFNLENFELVSPNQRIAIDDINNRGLVAQIAGFDISYLNELWVNDKFEFGGVYSLDLEVDDLYDIGQLACVLQVPALTVNDHPYGQWRIVADMKDPQDSVRLDISMRSKETILTGRGAYLPPIKSVPKHKQNYLRLDLLTADFPLDFLEFLIGSNIRDTEGSVDMTLSLKGKTNQLVPNGAGRVYNGSTTIDYLGAAYSFHDQAFRITESAIDLSGVKIYDVMGNTATVEGGLTHRYLRDLGLNATLTSDRIIGLDVTSEQNNIFYGKGIGSVYARFTGTVANPYMQIQSTTAKGTHISIPLKGGASSTDGDFVVFLENGQLPVVAPTNISLGGINLTMNLTITPDAIVEIIFDENTGEILRGIGQGNLNMSMNRAGNFSMYGSYQIERGDYLFTNFRVVRKPFELLSGGLIQWDGDPYNANINIRAKYKDLRAAPAPLIEEFLAGNPNQDLQSLARDRTRVDLTMILTGKLLQPDISFDIALPELIGELKAYTDAKISTLKANENAMLEQVVGLLITRSFLPSASTGSSGILSAGIDNTVSELISATLSAYLGGLLGDLIPEGTVLSGIDFQVGVDLPITQTGGSGVSNTGTLNDPYDTEVEVSLPMEFFNDRLTVNVGGNYVTGATLVEANQYFAGDVTFEYQLTADRRLKIRAYNQNTLTVEGRKNKVGVGFAYRREYDSFADIFKGKKKKKEEE